MQYRVLRGINFPPGKRAEAGEVRDDIPGTITDALLAKGAIEPAEAPTAGDAQPPAPKRKPRSTRKRKPTRPAATQAPSGPVEEAPAPAPEPEPEPEPEPDPTPEPEPEEDA